MKLIVFDMWHIAMATFADKKDCLKTNHNDDIKSMYGLYKLMLYLYEG